MKTKAIIFILAILCTLSSVSYAQKATPWVINDVPPNEINDRFLNDVISGINRPALSIVGFDNGGDHSKGYGLKQILNQAYVSGSNEQKDLLEKIIIESLKNVEYNPVDRFDYQRNSNILQYRAFEALASYVLEQNGVDSTMSANMYGITIRQHENALAAFKNDILALASSNKLLPAFDPFNYDKKLNSFTNIARAIDLYLALENAYKYWDIDEWENEHSTVLMSLQQKAWGLLVNFNTKLEDLNDNGIKWDMNLHFAMLHLPIDMFEPGNRPLKGYMGLAYAAMGTQGNPSFSSYISRAIHRGSSPTTSDRRKKWMYQTDNGQRFWAEGPYYLNYALTDVLPFWHAIRANNLLGSVSDPFNSSWFLNPIEWLADTSTPDGLTVPLDDGNKHSISATPLLRWSGVYGNAAIGMKFNHIYEVKNDYFYSTPPSPLRELYRHSLQTYLIEISMPKATSTISIDYDIVDSNEQQLIIRKTDSNNRSHFLLLNTEHGNAITRGEGHEQADQLQFLYYVDNESIIADTGYDEASVFYNSTWNKYYYNNGLHFHNHNEGGLPSPKFVVHEARKVSDHNETFDRHFFQQGQIRVMSAKVPIDHFTYLTNQKFNSQYARSILFIEEDSINDIPNYIIDFNTNVRDHLSFQESIRHTVHLRYHFGKHISESFNHDDWNNINFNNGNLSIFIQPVEWDYGNISDPSNHFYTESEIIQEYVWAHGVNRVNLRGLNSSSLSWTSATVIWFDDIVPTSIPIRTDGFNQGEYLRPFSAWAISISENIVDVYAKRTYTQGINTNNGFHSFFVPSINKSLILLQNKDYGFVRFKKDGGGNWVLDENYQLNLEILIPTPSVTIQGPSTINQGNSVQFNVIPSGGSGTYTSYGWQIKYENETEWVNLFNPSQTYNHTSTNTLNFELIASVTDSNNQTGWSSVKFVEVFPGHIQIVDPGTETFSEPEEDALNLEFKVNAAYPNPFNPVTQIQYSLPEVSDVRIEVFNVMGQKVATLENSRRSEGMHSVSFNALNLSSGMYMIRFTALGQSGSRFSDLQTISLVK